jgi:hypothetical protein
LGDGLAIRGAFQIAESDGFDPTQDGEGREIFPAVGFQVEQIGHGTAAATKRRKSASLRQREASCS